MLAFNQFGTCVWIWGRSPPTWDDNVVSTFCSAGQIKHFNICCALQDCSLFGSAASEAPRRRAQVQICCSVFISLYSLSCRNAAHGFSLIPVDSLKITMNEILQKALKKRKGSQKASGKCFF